MTEADLLSQLRIDPADRPGASAPRRRWRWVLALIVLLLAAAGTVLMLRGGASELETAVAEPAGAQAGALAVLEATGYVTARRQATVSTKITGKLEEVRIEEGDHVTANQVLAKLDDTAARAQLSLARARLAAARAQAGQLETQESQARRDLQRQRELHARGLAAEQALEDARTRLDALGAELEAQRRQTDVAQAEVRVAEVDHEDTIVRAPFSGVVIAKTAQPGEIVSPISAGGGFTRTGICSIVDMDSLEVEVDVNEAYINRVQPRQPVEAVLDAYPDWKIPARVIAIIPAADRSKATVRVRIALEQKDPRIVPDMGVRVAFLERRNDGARAQGVLVPATAVVRRGAAEVVYVVRDGRAERRPVTPGQRYGDRRLLERGVDAGERVVRDPPAELEDGARVHARDTQSG